MAEDLNNKGKEVVTGSATYEGETLDGMKHGEGTLTWDDGDKFEGVFHRDEKVRGTFTWKGGDRYTGEWKNSLMHGKGTYYYRNGRKYEGNWVAGYKEGFGTFTWPNGDSYEGEFHRDKCNGIGTQKFADQRIYKGQWSNNKKHGYGVMIWPNGEKSEGYWQNNVRCGLSIFTDAEGRRYEERWKNGAREGNKHMLGRKEHEMETLLKSSGSPPWALDADYKACYKCESAFTITNRRHHCRHCGLIFCGPCTTKKTAIVRLNLNEPVRVCDECFIAIKVQEVLPENQPKDVVPQSPQRDEQA